MTETLSYAKSINLVFRGFTIDPKEIERMIGVTATAIGYKGEVIRPGVKTKLTRSYAEFLIEFPNGYLMVEMIPSLLKHLQGVENICKIRDLVDPEFLEINIHIPIRSSDAQEDGYIDLEDLANIYKLHATLAFGFT